MKRTKNNQTNSKDQILKAAKIEFADRGFDGSRMETIARRAGVNKALLHYHFSTKENLYKEVLIQQTLVGIQLVERIKGLAGNLKLSPPEMLFLGINLLVYMHFEAMDTHFWKIISREMSENREHFKELIQDYLIPLHEAFENLILDGVKSGDFETKNPLFVVINLNTFVMNYVSSRNLVEGSSWSERLFGKRYREELVDFLVNHTFKSLSPAGKELRIPEIPKDVMDSFHEVIKQIKDENL